MHNNPLVKDLEHILDHTRELWEELRGERIFITGGTGFFGCWLLESFCYANEHLNLGAKALVLTRSPTTFVQKVPHLAGHPAVALQTGNILDFHFPEGNFTFVIHAATEASAALNNADPLLMFNTIVQGTARTLEFARSHGAKKMLFTSSGAVYGRQPAELTHIPETYQGAPDPLDPESAYGEGKRAAELLCALAAHQYEMEIKIARCFAFVGPYLPLDAHFAIGNFIHDALQGSPIHVNGDGRPYRSYLYAADLAIWLWTILFKGQSCQPYNVGSEAALTINELAETVANVVNPAIAIQVARKPDPTKPADRYVPSVERAREQLGLQDWVHLPEAIRRTADWKNISASSENNN